jgi:hypothetical protein
MTSLHQGCERGSVLRLLTTTEPLWSFYCSIKPLFYNPIWYIDSQQRMVGRPKHVNFRGRLQLFLFLICSNFWPLDSDSLGSSLGRPTDRQGSKKRIPPHPKSVIRVTFFTTVVLHAMSQWTRDPSSYFLYLRSDPIASLFQHSTMFSWVLTLYYTHVFH